MKRTIRFFAVMLMLIVSMYAPVSGQNTNPPANNTGINTNMDADADMDNRGTYKGMDYGWVGLLGLLGLIGLYKRSAKTNMNLGKA